ncbi:MAG: transcriptional regulator, partial [Polyangiaceae bacterium]
MVSSSEAFFRAHPVFTHEEYARSRESASARTVDSLLRKHVASGRIARVRRGLYVAPPLGTAPETVDPFLVGTKATPDAVVSHHAALQFHGRAYSMWNQVSFLTTHSVRTFRFGPVEYVAVRPPDSLVELPEMGGGVERVRSGGGEVRVCSLERAMVDVLHSPARAGGWEEIFRSLAMVEFFALEQVIPYTLAHDSALTAARVGYFLSVNQERLFVEQAHLDELAMHAPNQPRYFDASRAQGRLVHPWNLIVPEWVLER